MILDVVFEEQSAQLDMDFGQLQQITDGGFDRGYAEGEKAGYVTGHAAGLTAGVGQGKQEASDLFWDTFQENGGRTRYNYAFSSQGWTNALFKPKYPIVAVGDAGYMFDGCGLVDFDFVEKGIVLDTSGATSLTYAFRNCKGLKRLGVLDCTGCKDLNRLFYSCAVESIDRFIVSENITYSVPFEYATHLKNITVEGVVGNTVSFSYCPLSRKSVQSIMAALSDTAAGKTVTFRKTAVDTAFETAEGASDGSTSEEWLALVATKPNWTVSLV